jgi:hypothetical protein
MNKLLAAAAVAGILVSGSVIAAEPSEWCEGYEAGTTYILHDGIPGQKILCMFS